MTPRTKGLVLAGIQVVIVASLGAKLLADRARLPRVWAQSLAYDPDLPIRGRYASLRLRVHMPRACSDRTRPASEAQSARVESCSVHVEVVRGRLTAVPDPDAPGPWVTRREQPGMDPVVSLTEPVAFFLPEHATDPTHVRPGDELWVEVTVPPRGPPRPIRLGLRHNGVLTPIEP